MVDMDTSLQCDRTCLYAFVFAIYASAARYWLWRLVYTFTHSHIQTLNDESQPSLPPDFHSTIGYKMKGRAVMRESSQLFHMLKYNTLHTVGANGTLCWATGWSEPVSAGWGFPPWYSVSIQVCLSSLPHNMIPLANHILEDHWTDYWLCVSHRASLLIHKTSGQSYVFNEIRWT